MKRSSATSFQLFAAVASTDGLAAMSARCSSSYAAHRGDGGRNQFRRGGFSVRRQYSGGRGHQQFVCGDSHVESVHEANLGIRQSAPAEQPHSRPLYNPNYQFWHPPPPNYHHQFRQSPPFYHNTQGFIPAQQFRPPPPKQLNYRGWQYSKTAPLPNSEKFIVLSYNILADYLAIDHRSKLYYHVPRKMLDWEWRKRSILFELGLWSADIMCFQEVDRFKDLEDQLMLQGYSGIWKMRTGNAVDGCAIFWRTSRFKLRYEESIEFNKIGLRDNVAQICVLEHISSDNCSSNTSPLPISSAGSDKVVICNIHVLYNPKRGEIKLGQVRMLLDRAFAVSKTWNAPVVLCGDFNCTPKSPLYNFISENKLDLSGVDRDKVSGQASAEIRAPKQNNQNYNSYPNPSPRTHSSDSSIQAPLVISSKLDSSLSDVQKHNIPENDESVTSTNNSSQSQVLRNIPASSDDSCTVTQSRGKDSSIHMEETNKIPESVVESCKNGTESTISVLIDSFEDNLTFSHRNSESNLNHKSTSTVTSDSKQRYPDDNEMEQTKSVHLSNQENHCENLHSNICEENKGASIINHTQSLEGYSLEGSKFLSSHGIVSDENSLPSPASQANTSSWPANLYHEREDKLEDASPGELNDVQLECGIVCEDQSTFLSALHGEEDSFQTDVGQIGQLDSAHSQNEYASDPIEPKVHSPSNEVLDDVPLDLGSEAVNVEKTAYDPSLWTPMEIATATGSADCAVLEHPLKLKSAYTEVEDYSGTRDPNGEPLVTSYNRCFLGTVDYIWKSEGLHTVKVLAPIPKQAMQWTAGFPTKKWGSDHIALASEFAFLKDVTSDASDDNVKAQQDKE